VSVPADSSSRTKSMNVPPTSTASL
jgi:hypothetical protein